MGGARGGRRQGGSFCVPPLFSETAFNLLVHWPLFLPQEEEFGGVYGCSSSNTTKYDRAEKNKFLLKKIRHAVSTATTARQGVVRSQILPRSSGIRETDPGGNQRSFLSKVHVPLEADDDLLTRRKFKHGSVVGALRSQRLRQGFTGHVVPNAQRNSVDPPRRKTRKSRGVQRQCGSGAQSISHSCRLEQGSLGRKPLFSHPSHRPPSQHHAPLEPLGAERDENRKTGRAEETSCRWKFGKL